MRKLYFNELAEAEKIYKNGFTDGKFWDVYLLAKYLRTQKGYGETRIFKEIQKYQIKLDPYFEELGFKRNNYIKRIVRMVMKAKTMNVASPVTISKRELDFIYSIENFEDRKTLFAMLVFGRVKKQRGKNPNGKVYIDSGYLKQIKQMVGFRPCVNDFCAGPLHNLHKLGAVDSFMHFPRGVPMTTLVVTMADEEPSDVALVVDDFDDTFKFLPILCPKCGKPMDKKPTKKRNICMECYKERRREDIKNNVRKFRNQN